MRIISLFNLIFVELLSLFSFNSKNLKATRPESVFPILESFYFEPFSLSGSSLGYYSFQDGTREKIRVIIKIINDLYPKGTLIYDLMGPAVSKKTFFTYDNSYTRAQNKISIMLKHSTESYVYEFDMDLSNGGYVVLGDGETKFTSVSKSLAYYKGNWVQINEEYLFQGFDRKQVPSFYHEFSLDTFSIKTYFADATINSNYEAFLLVSNRNGIFNDFEHDDFLARIPISLYKKEEEMIGFCFKDILYVDPESLLMSTFSRNGYVETNHFYFPKNEMSAQGEYEIYLMCSNFGSDKVDFVATFKTKALMNTMGDCYTSEYCIRNTSAQINDNFGWAI